LSGAAGKEGELGFGGLGKGGEAPTAGAGSPWGGVGLRGTGGTGTRGATAGTPGVRLGGKGSTGEGPGGFTAGGSAVRDSDEDGVLAPGRVAGRGGAAGRGGGRGGRFGSGGGTRETSGVAGLAANASLRAAGSGLFSVSGTLGSGEYSLRADSISASASKSCSPTPSSAPMDPGRPLCPVLGARGLGSRSRFFGSFGSVIGLPSPSFLAVRGRWGTARRPRGVPPVPGPPPRHPIVPACHSRRPARAIRRRQRWLPAGRDCS
jgi:hypothetical protein